MCGWLVWPCMFINIIIIIIIVIIIIITISNIIIN